MLCSTGVHSMPNPRAGWTGGDPNTLMVALAGGNSADDWVCCATVALKGCGPTVVVKGMAEDPPCSWANAEDAVKDSTRMAARVNFIFVFSSGCSTCAIVPSPRRLSDFALRHASTAHEKASCRHALAVVSRPHIGDVIAEDSRPGALRDRQERQRAAQRRAAARLAASHPQRQCGGAHFPRPLQSLRRRAGGAFPVSRSRPGRAGPRGYHSYPPLSRP